MRNMKKRKEALKNALKDNVENEQSHSVLLSISKQGKIQVSGEKNLVSYLKSHADATFDEVLNKVTELHDNNNAALEYDEQTLMKFPKLKFEFKSKQWTLSVARDYLRTYFNILGFGKGQYLSYKHASNQPQGWPDTVAFETFEPNMVNKLDANEIIESLLRYHNIDVKKHHVGYRAQQLQVGPEEAPAPAPAPAANNDIPVEMGQVAQPVQQNLDEFLFAEPRPVHVAKRTRVAAVEDEVVNIMHVDVEENVVTFENF